MSTSKLLRTLLLPCCLLALASVGVACDDGDDGDSDSQADGTDTNATTTTGDGDGDACGDGGVYGDNSECPEYISCVETSCQTQYETCFGPSYLSGSFAGECADYMACNVACECGDTACTTACYNDHAAMGTPCGDCLLNEIGLCVAGNCLEAAQTCG